MTPRSIFKHGPRRACSDQIMAEISKKNGCHIEDGQEVCQQEIKFSMGSSKATIGVVVGVILEWVFMAIITASMTWGSTGDFLKAVSAFGYTLALGFASSLFIVPIFGFFWITSYSALATNMLADIGLTTGSWLNFIITLFTVTGIVLQIVVIAVIIFVIVLSNRIRS